MLALKENNAVHTEIGNNMITQYQATMTKIHAHLDPR